MLVSELIEKLECYPEDMHVYIQGKDQYEIPDPEPVDIVSITGAPRWDKKARSYVDQKVIVLSY